MELGGGGRERRNVAGQGLLRWVGMREHSLRAALRRGELEMRRWAAVDGVVSLRSIARSAAPASVEVRRERSGRDARIQAVGHEERRRDDIAGRDVRRVCRGVDWSG